MIHKNNGFTLIELMAVIAILAIVITIAASSIGAIMNNARKKTAEEMQANLKEVAITYAIEEFYLQKCSVSFSNAVYKDGNISVLASNANCAKKITVNELKNAGLFEDERSYCKSDDFVVVYRYYDGTNSEYKAYVSDSVCANY